MAQVYSRQLGDVFGNPGSTLTITQSSFFPGKQVVLRTIAASVNVRSGTLGSGPIWAVELTTGSGAQTALLQDNFDDGEPPDGQSQLWVAHLALGPTDVLQLLVNGAAEPTTIVNVVASGFLLSLP